MRKEDNQFLAKKQDICLFLPLSLSLSLSPKEISYHSIFHVEYENTAKATSFAKDDCHCRNLIIMEGLKSNHPFGIKPETLIKKDFCCTSISYYRKS